MLLRIFTGVLGSSARVASPWTRRALSTAQAQPPTDTLDVVVIGGGPGGYVAAIKAAQLGLKAACVEERGSLGGTCLNVGCIPSKALLHNTHLLHLAQHEFADRGIHVSNVGIDLPKLMANKTKTVTSLTSGIEMLFKKNNVFYARGHGKCLSSTEVEVTGADGTNNFVLKTRNIILATGSEPATIPGVEIDESRVVSSTGALSLREVPRNMVVVGAGVIGLELGSVWARMGANVTVVEASAGVGGTSIDKDIAVALRKSLEKRERMKFVMNAKVEGIEPGREVHVKTPEGNKSAGAATAMKIPADVVLLSVGRRPHTANLGLGSLGIKLDPRGKIPVDMSSLSTSVSGVWAIGDVIDGPMLAHKAEEEGIAVAETIASASGKGGAPGHVNYNAIPSVIYTYPEVAWVGLTEQEARATKGTPDEVVVGTFPFMANSRAKANGEPHGLVKIVTEKATDRILGAHIIGPNAGEMIAEATLAIEYGAASEDVARTCHAHPTLSEAFKEACLASHGVFKPIHF